MTHRLHHSPSSARRSAPPPAHRRSPTSSSTPADAAFDARYSALLLFEFFVTYSGEPGIRRLCEKRLVVFTAPSARKALAEAKRHGRKAQHRYRNSAGGTVAFRFVGVLELLQLGVECGPEEVWYALREYVRPMERRDQAFPRRRP